MNSAVMAGLGVLGLVFGSFIGAQVWRLRARQLADDKAAGEEYDRHDYKKLVPLIKQPKRTDRSRCLACGHVLSARDLVPLASWLVSRGKCRYCGQPIGKFEPTIELVTAALFMISYVFWPFGFGSGAQVGLFVLWLIAIVLLTMLAAYDTRWQLLPDRINYTLMATALVFVVLRYTVVQPVGFSWLSVAGSVGILFGLYAVIYLVSGGRWIGLGDVKLGVSLGLLLADWKLAFLALFLANLIGCFIVLPGLLSKKMNGESRIAFGPLLIVGTLIAFWWGSQFITWLFYKTSFM